MHCIYTRQNVHNRRESLSVFVCVCLSVCLSVYVCLKYLCRSGSDWSEIFNMAAAWFKGVQHRICLDCIDTANKLLHKCFPNSASTVNHSHQSQSLQSSLPWHTLRKKRIYTCSTVLLWINETERVCTESVLVWGDPDTLGQQSGIGICGYACVASC